MERILNPNQEKFITFYLDPESDTFGNAVQSGLKAGYEEEYARNILSLMPKWLKENLEDAGLVSKALSNLSTFIDSEADDPTDKKLKWDATKFTLDRLSKKFRDKKDITSDGKPINIVLSEEIAGKNGLT